MTKTSELTNEMISDYMRFSEKKIASVNEYMLFRAQAIRELDAYTESSESVPVPQTEKNQTSKTKNETMSHYNGEDTEYIQKNASTESDNNANNDDDFLACVNRIED